MTWLELWTQTPLAKALGWTLLHSLWQGAAVALLFAAALSTLRSARARYAAACFALAAILASFTFTLAHLWPAHVVTGGPHGVIPPPPQLDPLIPDTTYSSAFHAADLLPWLAPFWMLGVLTFHLRALAGWLAARRLRRSGVCCAETCWTARLNQLAKRIRVSRPVVLFESSLADAPVVIGYLRPIILMPVGLLAGLSVAQVEAILAHELAHIRRQDYLVNLVQTFIEGLLFYHPAVWWISHIIRAERENCCDDLAVALSGNAREYAAALTALEQNRFNARELALAATGGSLVKRIRRILNQPQRSRVRIAPLSSAIVVILATAAGLAAWQSTPLPQTHAQTQAPAAAPVIAPLATAAVDAQATLPVTTKQDTKSLAVQEHMELVRQVDALAQRAKAARKQTAEQMRWTASAAMQDQTAARPQLYKKWLKEDAAHIISDQYKKWLNEDVAYIISDQERKDFKAIETDEQRETFIEQFWQKRDPTPGTPENEYKQEHYRRIAYANEHFASYVPGWKTDRGRIYITFGPPDEIEDHASGGFYERPPSEGGGNTLTVPFQQWRYRYLEGVGNNIIIEFVDPTNTHEFRMTTDPAEKDALRYTTPPKSGNSFISVGGDPQITVAVAGSSVSVEVQQNGMEGKWDFTMSVTSNGKPAANLHDSVKMDAVSIGKRFPYNGLFHLAPGSYSVNVTVKDPTGASQTKSVAFYVN